MSERLMLAWSLLNFFNVFQAFSRGHRFSIALVDSDGNRLGEVYP
jgi:hypothetical protein